MAGLGGVNGDLAGGALGHADPVHPRIGGFPNSGGHAGIDHVGTAGGESETLHRLAVRQRFGCCRRGPGDKRVHRIAGRDILPAAETVGYPGQPDIGAGIDPYAAHAGGVVDRGEAEHIMFVAAEIGAIHDEFPALAGILAAPETVAAQCGVQHVRLVGGDGQGVDRSAGKTPRRRLP